MRDDAEYGYDWRGLWRAMGLDRPRGPLWFRVISMAWLAGYKLECVDFEIRLTPRGALAETWRPLDEYPDGH